MGPAARRDKYWRVEKNKICVYTVDVGFRETLARFRMIDSFPAQPSMVQAQVNNYDHDIFRGKLENWKKLMHLNWCVSLNYRKFDFGPQSNTNFHIVSGKISTNRKTFCSSL
jgi:hypothetical protein